MKFIIGITGKIGSGKTIIANHISKKCNNAPIYRFSKILLDILRRLYLESTRENFQKLGSSLREEFGKDVIVNAMMRDLEKEKGKVVIIDGIRYLNEIEMLEKLKLSKGNNVNTLLIGVDASPRLRYERCINRKNEKKKESSLTFEEFLILSEKKETEKEIDLVLKKVDYLIDNNSKTTKEELMKKIDEILEKEGII